MTSAGLRERNPKLENAWRLLRRQFEQSQRFAVAEPCDHFLERRALEVAAALFFLQPLEAAFGLIEVGEHQLALDAFERRDQIFFHAGELRNDDQQRVHVAHQRQQARVERSALLLLFGIWREVEDGELDRNFFLRAVGRFKKIETRIRDLDLSRARAIAALGRARNRRESCQRVKYGRFSGAARADDASLQFPTSIFGILHHRNSGVSPSRTEVHRRFNAMLFAQILNRGYATRRNLTKSRASYLIFVRECGRSEHAQGACRLPATISDRFRRY